MNVNLSDLNRQNRKLGSFLKTFLDLDLEVSFREESPDLEVLAKFQEKSGLFDCDKSCIEEWLVNKLKFSNDLKLKSTEANLDVYKLKNNISKQQKDIRDLERALSSESVRGNEETLQDLEIQIDLAERKLESDKLESKNLSSATPQYDLDALIKKIESIEQKK